MTRLHIRVTRFGEEPAPLTYVDKRLVLIDAVAVIVNHGIVAEV